MKRAFPASLLCLIGLWVLSACDSEGKETGKSAFSVPSGEELFMQSCSSCHGEDLVKGYAPDLDKIGSKYDAREIEDIILNGTGTMPKGLLKGEEAKAVAEWLATRK